MIINLHNIDIDNATAQRLLQIARTHCKLVLEHGRTNTPYERRQAIKSEIETIRSERDCLIKQFD